MSETKPRRRRALIALASILGAITVLDTLVWFTVCRRLDDGARAAAAAAGWTLSAGPARWRGWPVAAEIVLPDTVLRSGPDIIPPLTWTAGTQTFRLGATHPARLTISAAGPQSLAVADAPPVPFTAAAMVATLDLTGHDPARLQATDLAATFPGGPAHVASAFLDALPDGLALRLSALSLPNTDGKPIDPPIDRLNLVARLSAPVVPMPTAIESARRWRAAGGKLTIDDAALDWGPLAATVTATLTLDPALQPILDGQVAATGLPASLDRLAATGAITASGTLAIRGMLAILSAPYGTGPVKLPVTLRDGILSLARIPVLRLAPLIWN